MRVAIVTESFLPAINGVTNSVLRTIDTLAEAGHEVLIIAPTSIGPEYKGFRVVTTPVIPLKKFAVGMPMPWLAQEFARFSPHVVHVASPFALGGNAISVAEKLGIPTVAVYQTDLAGYMARYRLTALRPMIDRLTATIHTPATLNLAPTPESRKYLENIGVPRVAEWGRGVDLAQFHPNHRNHAMTSLNRRAWAPNGEVIVGYVGRLAAEKQVERFAELSGRWENVRFVIVGDGPERKNLESQFDGLPVVFTGALRGTELSYAYATFDAFVHFGTEETFGQTIQEAKAAGIPVVAPNSGGPRHLIEHGIDGFLVEPSNPQSFADALNHLIYDERLRARVGEAGRRSVLGRSWEQNNAQLLAHYRDAIKTHSRKRKSDSVVA